MIDRAEIQRLMTAAADGDRAAVEPLFAALWPIVVGYATRFLGNATHAEDCAQDSLVKLFGQLARFDRERDALTWALTHATWQCRTERRKRERRGEDSASVEIAPGMKRAGFTPALGIDRQQCAAQRGHRCDVLEVELAGDARRGLERRGRADELAGLAVDQGAEITRREVRAEQRAHVEAGRAAELQQVAKRGREWR